MQRFCLEKNNF